MTSPHSSSFSKEMPTVSRLVNATLDPDSSPPGSNVLVNNIFGTKENVAENIEEPTISEVVGYSFLMFLLMLTILIVSCYIYHR